MRNLMTNPMAKYGKPKRIKLLAVMLEERAVGLLILNMFVNLSCVFTSVPLVKPTVLPIVVPFKPWHGLAAAAFGP